MNTSHTSSARAAAAARPRLVIVPGLHGSGAEHWQSWLEGETAGAVRAVQDDWSVPDLERWSDRVAATLAALGPGPHAVVAHSFGCLATVRAVLRDPSLDIGRVLLVAPAEPARFDVAHALPQARLAMPSCVVGSDSDPWMSATQAHAWALRWGSDWINLGNAGHVNVDSGYGPFPLAREWAVATLDRLKAIGAGSWRAAGLNSWRRGIMHACEHWPSSPKSWNPARATPIGWMRWRVTCARSGATRARSRASGWCLRRAPGRRVPRG